jgi:4-amino-4-deoxy-L-arabinose transferase-like glycosyltransferase
MNFLCRHKVDMVIFALALIARVFLFYVNYDAVQGNFIAAIHGDDGYYEISKNIFLGNGFSGNIAPPYIPNPLRTPIYPWFIAIILFLFKSYWAVLAFQLVIGAMIPVLGRHIARVLAGSRRVGLWVGLALSLEPHLVLFSSIFYTETLFIFLFLFFILAFLLHIQKGDVWTLILSAFILGIATLTKTTVQYLPFLLIPLLAWHFRAIFSVQQLFARAFIFLTIFLFVLSPWFYRNYREFGVVGMSAQPAYNLFVYLVPSVLAVEHGTNFATELKEFVFDRGFNDSDITLATASFYTQEAINVLKKHPKGLALVALTSFTTFFTHDGMLAVLQHAGFTPETHLAQSAISLLITSPTQFLKTVFHFLQTPFAAVLIMRILWIAVTIAFLCGSITFIRKNRAKPQAIFALLLVLYFLVITNQKQFVSFWFALRKFLFPAGRRRLLL